MNYQNDITKDTDIKRTEYNLSDTNTLNFKSFFDFSSKKTEKLVMAIYMVTDGIDMDEVLKTKLRSLSVELMSEIHKISNIYKTQKNVSIIYIQSKISEITSFIEVAQTIGFISDMNSGILKKEFTLLENELVKFEEENKPKFLQRDILTRTATERFSLNKDSFFVSLPTYKQNLELSQGTVSDKGQIKDTFSNNVLYKKYGLLNLQKDKSSQISREERRKQIIDFIKDKDFISIKDISFSIKDCSEKTLQRELNELVSQGQVIKEGEKRWSKYKIK